MTMKTPQEIAAEIEPEREGHGLDNYRNVRKLIVRGIHADRAQRAEPIHPDWQDDAADIRDAYRVEIRWTAYDKRGNITFNSDDTITGAQAAAMFEAIGRTEA